MIVKIKECKHLKSNTHRSLVHILLFSNSEKMVVDYKK